MTDKGLLEALSDDDTHFAGDLAGEQPLAVEDLLLQAQHLKDKGWLLPRAQLLKIGIVGTTYHARRARYGTELTRLDARVRLRAKEPVIAITRA